MEKDDRVFGGGSETDALLSSLKDEVVLPSLGLDDPTDPSRPEHPLSPGHRKSRSMHEIPSGGPRRKGRHHRHKSSLSQLRDIFLSQRHLATISEGVLAEGDFLRETLVQELEYADQGKTFFLDMSMTRSLSILPESMAELVEEATGIEVETEAPEEANPIGRYLALLGAVMAVSSNGTALAMLTGVEQAMKLYWRMTSTALVLSVFAFRSLSKDGFPKQLSWMTFVGAIICFTAFTLCFYCALEYTSIGNAVIGANSQAILLILGKLLVGERVLWMEGGGVLLAFLGCIMCVADEATDNDDDKSAATALFGNGLALLSGAFGVGYLTFAKAIRSQMSVTLFMFLMMLSGSFLILLYMVAVGIPVQFSNDPFVGLFGWMNLYEHRLYIMLHIAVVCNVLGFMGFVRAMQFFDNLVIAVATLLEPMTATLIAFVVGVGELPGWIGWMGNILVVCGTLGVVYPSVNNPHSNMEH